MTNINASPFKNHSFLLPYSLKPYLSSFIHVLSSRGYSALTIQGYIDSISHFGTWLHSSDLALKEINRDVLSRFAQHNCNCPGGRELSRLSRKYVNRVNRFISYLDSEKVILLEFESTDNDTPTLLLQFREHLKLRGLSPITITQYEHDVSTLIPVLGDNPSQYNANIIRQAIGAFAEQHSIAKTKSLTVALRAYLRFLIIENLCLSHLDSSVPTVAQWSLSSRPRYITAQEIEQTIEACATTTTKGLRDRAIILLLSRLGLRAGDAVNMRLDDIDWKAGTLRVKGKGNREDILPLPQSVGDAVIAYLNESRPPVTIERLFLCLNAPYRGFSSSSAVSAIVATALSRAGISHAPSHGAHLLRHSAATNMLRDGASLEAVSSMLRHKSLDMTAYYAKVDIPQLRQIAQPWPGVTSC